MNFYHISHTDLDGYGCHLVSKEYFDNGMYLNANYGLEVKLSIKKVLNDIKEKEDKSKTLILITDLNLTYGESKDIDKEVNQLNSNGYDIELQLLDHHATGKKSADQFEWYFLDIERCATKITYDYFCENYNAFEDKKEWLAPLVDCINAIDIWLEHEKENFEFGKVLMSMVSGVREINQILFADLNREFRIHLLKEATKFINKEDRNILLDENIHKMKKEYLCFDGKNDTLDNLSAKNLVKTLDDVKDKLTVTYKGHKGLLTYTLGSVSIPANAFLKANDEYDFFIDVGRKGNTSFRADGKVDVSQMAAKLANGGGHVNASGCKFEDFRETIDYKKVQSFIQEKLNNI